MEKPLLVLGTRNRKKGLELAELLGPFGFELRTLADFPNSLEVEEIGESFAENAMLKAVQQALHLQAWVLGEDSGLCVPALNGSPGIYSARFAGPGATDDANNAKLLAEMSRCTEERRIAFYVCHATLAAPDGSVRAESEGRCYGRIRSAASGSAGFGYDPLFEIAEYHRTFGELGNAVKSIISHRARAMREIIPQIVSLSKSGTWFHWSNEPTKKAGPEKMTSGTCHIKARPQR
jgi:XTP/dITP diphosphohydrolase